MKKLILITTGVLAFMISQPGNARQDDCALKLSSRILTSDQTELVATISNRSDHRLLMQWSNYDAPSIVFRDSDGKILNFRSSLIPVQMALPKEIVLRLVPRSETVLARWVIAKSANGYGFATGIRHYYPIAPGRYIVESHLTVRPLNEKGKRAASVEGSYVSNSVDIELP